MANNLGGFTKIYPLDSQNPRQAVYQQLIALEAQASGDVKKPKVEQSQPPIARRNTQKIAKLPIISKDPQEPKEEIRKVLQSRKNA